MKDIFDKVKNVVDTELIRYNSFVKLEIFRLVQVKENLPFYVKETFGENFKDFKPSFKCVHKNEFPLCFKEYFKLPVHNNDQLFCKYQKLFENKTEKFN